MQKNIIFLIKFSVKMPQLKTKKTPTNQLTHSQMERQVMLILKRLTTKSLPTLIT